MEKIQVSHTYSGCVKTFDELVTGSTDEEDTEEEIKEEIRYEEIKPEIKAEEKSDQVKAQVSIFHLFIIKWYI